MSKLKAGKSIISPIDGITIKPNKHIIFDSPLGYAHHETAGFIDFMVFIDTPPDIAMARRLVRGYALIPPDSAGRAIDSLKAELTAYLDMEDRLTLKWTNRLSQLAIWYWMVVHP